MNMKKQYLGEIFVVKFLKEILKDEEMLDKLDLSCEEERFCHIEIKVNDFEDIIMQCATNKQKILSYVNYAMKHPRYIRLETANCFLTCSPYYIYYSFDKKNPDENKIHIHVLNVFLKKLLKKIEADK